MLIKIVQKRMDRLICGRGEREHSQTLITESSVKGSLELDSLTTPSFETVDTPHDFLCKLKAYRTKTWDKLVFIGLDPAICIISWLLKPLESLNQFSRDVHVGQENIIRTILVPNWCSLTTMHSMSDQIFSLISN